MKELTSGELAKLFNISKSKIRHYIDKGILTPKRNQENKYYFFNESDIYRLYQIQALRKIGFSIKEIQDSLLLDNTESLFTDAEIKIKIEIDKLLATQKMVSKIVDSQKKYKLNEIIFLERRERYYKKVKKELLEGNSIDYSKAIKEDFLQIDENYFILSEKQSAIICLKSTKEDCDYILPAGKYICKSFVIRNELDIKNEVENFLNYLKNEKKYYSINPLLLYENIYCSLAYNDKMVYTIEVKL
ncbi:MAG: MerR family transcriptional regulator [Peptostreptococcus sp.]|uniref:MerR family transcriptional regulator n=1 Tax=Peptostreptococcus sp. TaxID=1262 RepID=UPI002FC8E0AE